MSLCFSCCSAPRPPSPSSHFLSLPLCLCQQRWSQLFCRGMYLRSPASPWQGKCKVTAEHVSKRASSSHVRLRRNGLRLAPITGIAPPESPPNHHESRRIDSPRGYLFLPQVHARHAQHTPPTPNRTIGLSCFFPLYDPNHQLLIWISTHAKNISQCPTNTHA